MGLINLWKIDRLYEHIRKAIENPSKLGTQDWWLTLYTKAWSVKEIREMLQGYKTYIVAALTAVVTLLHALGRIDDATYQTLLALLASGGAATVAAKINRMNTSLK